MGVKLSDLTTESSPAGTDIIGIADPTTGIMRKITVSALKTYMDSLTGDTTPPTVVSATVENATPNQVTIVFSESVTVTTAGWSFRRNTSSWAISSVSGSGTTWTFTMATSAASGETLDRSYNSATGNTLDTASNELASFTNSSVTNNVGGYDADSAAFFAANTGLSTTIKDAIDAFVVGAKADSIWSKAVAIYPLVGGSAAAHKWNLKDPQDTDAAHRATFAGTVTHDSNGITGDGSTGYIDTKLNPSTSGITQGSGSFGLYFRGTAESSAARHGAVESAGGDELLISQDISGSFYHRMWDDGTTITATQVAKSRLVLLSRTSTTSFKAFRDGTQIGTTNTTTETGNPPNLNIYVLAQNEASTANYFSNASIGFIWIGTSLTDTDVSNLNSRVTTLMTALSRNA